MIRHIIVVRPSGKCLTLCKGSLEIGRSTSTLSTNCGNRGGRSANVVLRTIVLVLHLGEPMNG